MEPCRILCLCIPPVPSTSASNFIILVHFSSLGRESFLIFSSSSFFLRIRYFACLSPLAIRKFDLHYQKITFGKILCRARKVPTKSYLFSSEQDDRNLSESERGCCELGGRGLSRPKVQQTIYLV